MLWSNIHFVTYKDRCNMQYIISQFLIHPLYTAASQLNNIITSVYKNVTSIIKNLWFHSFLCSLDMQWWVVEQFKREQWVHRWMYADCNNDYLWCEFSVTFVNSSMHRLALFESPCCSLSCYRHFTLMNPWWTIQPRRMVVIQFS